MNKLKGVEYKLKEFKEIEIVFENCEVITIKREDIYSYSFSEVSKEYTYFGDIEESLRTAKKVALTLNPSADKDYTPFGLDDVDISTNVFERIMQYRDIVSIDLIYSEDKEKRFFVPWDYSNEDDNKWQKAEYVTNDRLLITIEER